MTEKWTPGPWTANKYFGDADNWYVRGAAQERVCGNASGPVGKANAHLIAAAPDVHASASPIADELGFAEWATPEGAEEILQKIIRDYYPALRAALSRARGE